MVSRVSQKKNWAQLEPRFWKSVVETKIFPLDPWRTGKSKAQFFLGHPGYQKTLTWKFQDCTASIIQNLRWNHKGHNHKNHQGLHHRPHQGVKCGYLNIHYMYIHKYLQPSIVNIFKQEWSSMESNSYENWDETEMLFGHFVIGN